MQDQGWEVLPSSPPLLGTTWTVPLNIPYPKGPCIQIVDALAPKYLYRDYFKAEVYTIGGHGPLGLRTT